MKSPYKELIGILLSGGILSIVILGISNSWPFLKDPNPLDKVEERIDEVIQKEKILTENEKQLKQQSISKEWNDLDKEDK